MTSAHSQEGFENWHPLRKLRSKHGVTQAELANLSQVAKRTISSIEQSNLAPRYRTRRKLLRALEVSFAEHQDIFGP